MHPPVVVHFHGGAFVMRYPEMDDWWCRYLAAEAGFRAAEQAVLTHGGMGYAQEYHVERLFREAMLPRIAPVSRELVLSYLAERVLGQPKSY